MHDGVDIAWCAKAAQSCGMQVACMLGNRTVLHLAGSTDTSLWTHYSAGARDYCGNSFPDGMRKNERYVRTHSQFSNTVARTSLSW